MNGEEVSHISHKLYYVNVIHNFSPFNDIAMDLLFRNSSMFDVFSIHHAVQFPDHLT